MTRPRLCPLRRMWQQGAQGTEDDFGYTVECSKPHCEGVPPLAENPAVPTKRAAWELWAYMNRVERKEAA